MGKAKRDRKAERDLFALNDTGHHATFVLASRQMPSLAQDDGYLEYLRADSLLELLRLREAEQAAREALKLCGKESRRHSYCILGRILRDAGRPAEAIQQYEAAIRAEPDHAQGYIYLGGLYAYLGNFEKSSKMRERATRFKKGVIDEAWVNLGYLRTAQERFSEARECFQRALKIDPKYKAAKDGLRQLDLVSAGVPKISLNALRAKIKRINDSKASVPSYLILLTWEFLKKSDSIDAFILYLHCQALGQVARYDEALALLPKVFEVLPKAEHNVWHEFATIHAQRMNFKEAGRYFRKALTCKPGYEPSCRDLGILRRKQGRFAEAEKLLNLAVRNDPDNDYNCEELGHLYRATERFSLAALCYEKALALNPKSKDVRVALDDVRAAQRWLKLHG